MAVSIPEPAPSPPDLSGALARFRTASGASLRELSDRAPVLLVFLRHFGCPFCGEAMCDLSRVRSAIDQRGVKIVLVHMGSEEQARPLFARHGMNELDRVSDPERELYRALGLKRGNPWQLFGPFVWFRLIQAAIAGVKVGKQAGDAFQMPGSFLIHKGRVLRAFRHRSQASRPDYVALAQVPEAGWAPRE